MNAARRIEPAALLPLLGWTAFVLAVLYAVLLGGGWQGIYSAGLRWFSLVLVTVGMACWALLAWRRPEWRPRSAIWPALGVPLAAMALTTSLSPWPRLGIEYVAWSVLLVALYLLLARVLAWPFGRERIGGLAAVLCGGIGIWYLVVVGRTWLEWWGLVGLVTQPPLRPAFAGLTYGNPSAVMTIEVLLIAAAVGGLGVGTPTRRAIAVVLTLLTGATVLISGSRAGWLAVAGAIAIVGFLWLLAPGHRGRLAALLTDRRVRIAVAVTGVAFTLVAIVTAPGLLLRAGAGGDELRVTYAETALRMFEQSPVTGLGPGAWVAQRVVMTNGGEPDYYIPHAHDIYVQTLAEHGLVGAIAGVVVLGVVGWLLFRAIRGQDLTRRRWGWAALFGLVYLGLHQVLDFYANMPAAMLALAFPIAWLDATSDRSVPIPGLPGGVPRGFRVATGGVLVVAVGLSIAALAAMEGTAQVEQAAVDVANDAGPAAALIDARSAAESDPAVPAYQVTLGLAAAPSGDLAGARAAFEHSTAVDDLPQAWVDLAAVYTDLGDAAGARDALARALRLGQQQPVVLYAAGYLYDRLGDAGDADQAYVQALSLAPSLAGDPAWTASPDVAQRWPAILDTAMRGTPANAWEMALVSGDAERAQALTGESGDPAFASLVIRAWDGDAASLAALEDRAQETPLDVGPVGWAARVQAHLGNAAEARRYREWAVIVNGGGAIGYELRSVPAGTTGGDGAAGSAAQFYGHYTYRRPTPWVLIVESLPRLEFE